MSGCLLPGLSTAVLMPALIVCEAAIGSNLEVFPTSVPPLSKLGPIMTAKGNNIQFRRERADTTTRVASAIIAVEKAKRALKTERLRAARLEVKTK
ncbi:hypothetical protein [Aureimonas fodinaquatilis]|uniref:hypothetical protein n=1 Tax=Aureimonas fodinaquatilis TaxID=2565783 RepID=UPI00165D4569|nr:hypothetical protein [Aureimonas fodinaquatilis]